jgi:hypothetical protein
VYSAFNLLAHCVSDVVRFSVGLVNTATLRHPWFFNRNCIQINRWRIAFSIPNDAEGVTKMNARIGKGC